MSFAHLLRCRRRPTTHNWRDMERWEMHLWPKPFANIGGRYIQFGWCVHACSGMWWQTGIPQLFAILIKINDFHGNQMASDELNEYYWIFVWWLTTANGRVIPIWRNALCAAAVIDIWVTCVARLWYTYSRKHSVAIDNGEFMELKTLNSAHNCTHLINDWMQIRKQLIDYTQFLSAFLIAFSLF